MSDKNNHPDYLDNEWNDKTLKEEMPTIIDSLGWDGDWVIYIKKTEFGYRFTECCDGYFGTTLSQEQIERFIKELRALSKRDTP